MYYNKSCKRLQSDYFNGGITLDDNNQTSQVVSTVLSLDKPEQINAKKVTRTLQNNWVVVEPTYASVCHADERYYSGKRRPEALAKKLPMALLHEGIGVVKQSQSSKFQVGQRVVIVPGIPGKDLHNANPATNSLPANYDNTGVFMSSGYDGIAQSAVVQPANELVAIPDNVPNELAILTEVSTIGYEASTRVKHILQKKDIKVGLFGDGPVGYMAAAVLHYIWHLDKEHLVVFGGMQDRIQKIDFATTYLSDQYDFDQADADFDLIFEATGGNFSSTAINEAIKVLNPLGSIVLMGVSENLVPIDTRDVLEKGLTLYGTSRSVAADFQVVLKAISESEAYQQTLKKLLPDQVYAVHDAADLMAAFQEIIARNDWHKAIIEFHWH